MKSFICLVLYQICRQPHKEPNGETACWGHYFNNFIGVLLFVNTFAAKPRKFTV